MKKSLLFCLALVGGKLAALPLGNPAEPTLFKQGIFFGDCEVDPCDPCGCWYDALSLRMGFYGDYSVNHKYDTSGVHANDHGVLQNMYVNTNAGYLVLNFCDWVDFFATVGTSSVFFDGNGMNFSFANSHDHVRIKFSTDFSWSVGGRLAFWECNNFALGVEGQYLRSTPNMTYLERTATGRYFYFPSGEEVTFSQWQVGGGLSYTVCTGCPGVAFVPYIGTYYAKSKIDTNNPSIETDAGGDATYQITDMESEHGWGYAVGMTATLNEAIGVTVEGRFANETAISVIGQFRF